MILMRHTKKEQLMSQAVRKLTWHHVGLVQVRHVQQLHTDCKQYLIYYSMIEEAKASVPLILTEQTLIVIVVYKELSHM